jgi:serine/threonine protein phosphatase 1
MGDLHGAYRALVQCLERSGFERDSDVLIQLGDVADGHDEVYECVETLLNLKHVIAIKGNHDEWFKEFIETGYHPSQWTQGAVSTARSYLRKMGKEDRLMRTGGGFKTALNPDDIPKPHRDFFHKQRLYHIDHVNRCFVHGGFDRQMEFAGQAPSVYYWDRMLWAQALSFAASKWEAGRNARFKMVTSFKSVFIGHTSTLNWKTDQPMKAANVWNLDTGAGYWGRLTIMDVETEEYWQSDLVKELYKAGP